MGRDYADSGKRWNYSRGDKKTDAIFAVSVSGYSERPCGKPVYCDEYDCQCVWAWLGGDAGWAKGNGGIGKVGR